MNKELLEVFACPLCHSSLEKKNICLFCVSCRKRYFFREGIVDFRIKSKE